MSDSDGRLLQDLERRYRKEFPTSAVGHRQAHERLIDGVSHTLRAYPPYPIHLERASAAYVWDRDGHRLIDLWQGHYANILGHNPSLIREKLAHALSEGEGLQTGFPEQLQSRYATRLAEATGGERVRLTTSGTLATMYAMMLARAFTERDLVVKMGGGWHGAHPLALKGVAYSHGGYQRFESAGINGPLGDQILVTSFNNSAALEKLFKSKGDQIACIIMEPCPSGAGFIPATDEFMATAQRLTRKHGALLILDEIITGFRFCSGGMVQLYDVQPDLSTYGKIIGGGMPIAAVVGRADIMDLLRQDHPRRVWFNGGTFSGHPLALLAGETMLTYLMQHGDDLYPALQKKGKALRKGVENAFAQHGIVARCTGYGTETIPGGSLASVSFPYDPNADLKTAADLHDPTRSDIVRRERLLKLAMLLEGVHVVHGLGAVSATHTMEDVNEIVAACQRVAAWFEANA